MDNNLSMLEKVKYSCTFLRNFHSELPIDNLDDVGLGSGKLLPFLLNGTILTEVNGLSDQVNVGLSSSKC
jgi:hypothetical protein